MNFGRAGLLLRQWRRAFLGLGFGLLASVANRANANSLTNGLVTHLTFDGAYSDSSGSGVVATPVGAPTFAPGQIGQAVVLTTRKDGSEFDYVSLGYPDVLRFTNRVDFAISFWVNYTNQVDDPPFISNKDWGSSDNPGWGIFAQDNGNLRLNVTDGFDQKESNSSTPVIRDGHWHNVVASFVRGAAVSLYVDGQLALVDDLSGVTGSIDTSLQVNIGQDGTGQYDDLGFAQMIGLKFDDLGIWRRALSAGEVSIIYNNGLAGRSFDVDIGSPAPSIVSQPTDQTHFAGIGLQATVVATGAGDTYQWLHAGSIIPGATNATLVIGALQASDAGAYSVVVTNSVGSASSLPFNVNVLPSPASCNVTNALAAHYSFDATYDDSSGNGLTGKPFGAAFFETGQVGPLAVSISATGDDRTDYVSLGYPNALKFGNDVDFSVAFWTRYFPGNQFGDPVFISNKNWNSSSNPGWGIFMQDGGNFRVNVTGDAGGTVESTTKTPVIRDGQWHHVVVTFARLGNASIYVDGRLYSTDPLSGVTGSIDNHAAGYTVNLGQDGTGLYSGLGSALMYNVLVDDLGIWRRALTGLEIENVYLFGLNNQSFNVPPPAPPRIVRFIAKGASLNLGWTGGSAPFLLQKKYQLSDTNWIDLLTVDSRTVTVTLDGDGGFFRVVGPAPSDVTPFTLAMNGAAEIPNAVATAGVGSGALSYENGTLTYHLSYSGLSGPATGAFILGPATANQIGKIIAVLPVPSTDSAAGVLSGSVDLNTVQATAVLNGQAYVNIYTAANTGGEIRGQITP